MEAAISSTALVTVEAYRNIATDPVKRGPLINVRHCMNYFICNLLNLSSLLFL